MKDLHPFTLNPDGSQRDALRAYVIANVTHGELRAARIAVVYATLAIGLLNWFSDGWPDLLPSEVSSLAWASWIAGFLGVLVVGALEWIWHKKVMRCLSRLGQPFKDGMKPESCERAE